MRSRCGRRGFRALLLVLAMALTAAASRAGETTEAETSDAGTTDVERIEVRGERTPTATSSLTIPASAFELRPLESGGQMLEAVPNLMTAQHTGGGKAEQYFVRGFDADHGTDLAVYFDGVPINLRSHAHGQGYLDLHFVTPETIERLDAYKGPYFARFGDFATAAAIEYVPYDALDRSFARFEVGEFDTYRTVAVASPRWGPFAPEGPAKGVLSFEAYHTDGPFKNDEDLWRYSGLARGSVDLGGGVELSGHALYYEADWNASGLVPQTLVRDGSLPRFGSLDPSEGGDSTRAQGKVQVDWNPAPGLRVMANAYLAYYDLDLFSNFTYFLENDDDRGDGIVQRDRDRIYTGGRVEASLVTDRLVPARLLAGLETRYDDVDVVLGTQTRRTFTGCQRDEAVDPDRACVNNHVQQLSVEPYTELQLFPAEWIQLDLGLRLAWFRFDGRDRVSGTGEGTADETAWLPKANLVLRPFSEEGPLASGFQPLRDLELFVNFGIGYHSNDARSVFENPGPDALARATGAEVGLRTRFWDRVEIAVDWWYLNLEDELVFVGDEGTTEQAGESDRQGIELVTSIDLFDWLYLRGDVAYTRARLDDGDVPVPQAPRVIARGATGVRFAGFAAELGVRHLGERYAVEDVSGPRLSSYTVIDLAARYRWRFIEIGISVENLADEGWRTSEFFYESRPIRGGPASEDFHFTPGNPRNVRGWVTACF